MSFLSPDSILNEVVKIREVQHMKASAMPSATDAVILGVSTAIGGIVGGRMGIALGGVIGTALLAYNASSDLRSVPEIIYGMAGEVKAKLVNEIRALAKRNGLAIMSFLSQIYIFELFLGALLGLLRNFLTSQMDMRIQELY